MPPKFSAVTRIPPGSHPGSPFFLQDPIGKNPATYLSNYSAEKSVLTRIPPRKNLLRHPSENPARQQNLGS